MREVRYFSPGTLEEALSLLAEYGGRAMAVAGGTDVSVDLHYGAKPEVIIYLGNLKDLKGITEEAGQLRIGALTTHQDILASKQVEARARVLQEAVAVLGTPSVRNIATLGGNLVKASPAADTAPPLLALGASVRLVKNGGERTVGLDKFFVGPGKTVRGPDELLAEVLISERAGKGKFQKLGRRKGSSLAVVSAAVFACRAGDGVCSDIGIAMGSVGPVPLRLKGIEAKLRGSRVSSEEIAAAVALVDGEISPIDDGRGTAWYRREVSRVLLERGLREVFN